jgi:hypothetical protein
MLESTLRARPIAVAPYNNSWLGGPGTGQFDHKRHRRSFVRDMASIEMPRLSPSYGDPSGRATANAKLLFRARIAELMSAEHFERQEYVTLR